MYSTITEIETTLAQAKSNIERLLAEQWESLYKPTTVSAILDKEFAVLAKELSAADRLAIGVPEAARRLSISTRYAYELLRRPDAPVLRLGNRTLVLTSKLEAWLEKLADEGSLHNGRV